MSARRPPHFSITAIYSSQQHTHHHLHFEYPLYLSARPLTTNPLITGFKSSNLSHSIERTRHFNMGKKSKRQRASNKASSHNNNNDNNKQPKTPQTLTPSAKNEETEENLRFEDPFVDELIEEEDVIENNENEDDDDDRVKGGDDDDIELIQSWHPLMGHRPDGDDEMELEMDPSAYKMYHTLSPEWPCLSFDLLRDNLGENRQRYPHSLQAVIGTQADNPSQNQVTVLKLSDLSKLPQESDNEEDILGDEYNKDDDDGSDSDSADEEDDVDLDPVLEHYSLPHYGGVNRLRIMPQSQNIVATWSDTGKVNLYDISDIRARFEASEGRGANYVSTGSKNGPVFTYGGHKVEGFAMDWSAKEEGLLATGDNDGNIHLWKGTQGTHNYTVTPSYESPGVSIEDLQWSPTEATVVCAAESGGHVAIYDTRAPHRAMLRPYLHRNTDVNVLSWNKLVSNLLATGGDDGTLCVWDLRHFGGSEKEKSNAQPKPLARFSCHQTPVTSVEWHPTDESMLAMSDEVGVYIYDLSVEEDTPSQTTSTTQLVADIPPQLLFCHSGSQQFKECHWHPQISSCVMTTAFTGFSVFIPSNL
ncbi:G-protein beta-subunit [Nitzschia inconspicua]|uniref:G-protein beta-subunit n=1 Tax=Nitzschia inconspicua TaxID=303405 RepID=A0A9K3LGB8_9STRA|nr:G-protein beta-subunit [Nitzschia inconspicua]